MNKMFVVDKEKARLFIEYLNYNKIKYDCADCDNKVCFSVCMSDEEYDDYEENYIEESYELVNSKYKYLTEKIVSALLGYEDGNKNTIINNSNSEGYLTFLHAGVMIRKLMDMYYIPWSAVLRNINCDYQWRRPILSIEFVLPQDDNYYILKTGETYLGKEGSQICIIGKWESSDMDIDYVISHEFAEGYLDVQYLEDYIELSPDYFSNYYNKVRYT